MVGREESELCRQTGNPALQKGVAMILDGAEKQNTI
jgi:hypothetical protein